MGEAEPRWMTYRELADALGISVRAAEARAKRHVRNGSWRRRTDNEPPKAVQVLVPPADLEAMRGDTAGSTRPRTAGDTDGGADPHNTAPATVPVGMLARVQQDAEAAVRAAEAERDAARQEAHQLRERAGRAEGEVVGLQEAMRRADAAAQRAEEGRREAEAARDAARGESATSREQVAAERERAEAAHKARQAAEAELAAWWTSGGRLKRAWKGFLARRGA
jgi:hypothetical protein